MRSEGRAFRPVADVLTAGSRDVKQAGRMRPRRSASDSGACCWDRPAGGPGRDGDQVDEILCTGLVALPSAPHAVETNSVPTATKASVTPAAKSASCSRALMSPSARLPDPGSAGTSTNPPYISGRSAEGLNHRRLLPRAWLRSRLRASSPQSSTGRTSGSGRSRRACGPGLPRSRWAWWPRSRSSRPAQCRLRSGWRRSRRRRS